MVKRAARDTVLPRGGGSDGTKPLFVAKDTAFNACWWSMHRDPAVFGPDAEEFIPERWEDPSLRPYWSYVPFGGGPRVCLGE
jgi:cytochrome P450